MSKLQANHRFTDGSSHVADLDPVVNTPDPVVDGLDEVIHNLGSHKLVEPLSVTDVKSNCQARDEVADDSENMLCSVKVLYEGPSKCRCCINWVEELPVDIEERIEDRQDSKRHALLVRMRKNHGGGKPLVLDSVVVQSKALKTLLADVFEEYAGITTTLDKLVFRPPFHEFFHEWHRFNEICNALPESDRAQAQLLQDRLKQELEDTLSTSKDLAKNGVVTHDYLWTIFRPGIDVFSSQRGHDCIYRLISADYVYCMTGPYYEIKAEYINCDGTQFGWEDTTLHIQNFAGTRALTDLEVVPLSLLPDQDGLKVRVTERGRTFREYVTPKYHYASYKALAKDIGGKKFSVDGRIVLDESAFQNFNRVYRPNLRPVRSRARRLSLDLTEISRRHSSSSPSSSVRSISPPVIIEDKRPKRRRNRRYSNSTRSTSRDAPTKAEKRPDLSDDLLYYCHTEVRGYCLQYKKWATFDVDSVGTIRLNFDAFDSLVMDSDLKRMILSFVETQVESKDSFDDIIEGKGRGIILLLEGSPGVGKTLTAEAVADKLDRPLYAISGGELGHDAFELERSLEMILDVAAKWDAVLLLDECDVFLEKRTKDNMKRNGIVAVFLRTLEYYNGILFMTTNRVNAIDPAFQSRIHLTIEYPDLDANARRQVWKRFLVNFCPDSTITDNDIDELAKVDANGREIKNLIKTAQLLARHDKVVLNVVHVKTVLNVMKRKLTVSSGKTA